MKMENKKKKNVEAEVVCLFTVFFLDLSKIKFLRLHKEKIVNTHAILAQKKKN